MNLTESKDDVTELLGSCWVVRRQQERCMRPPLRGDERWLWRGRWRAMVVFGLRLRLGVIMHFYCRCKSGKYGNLVTEDYLTINPLVIHYVVKIILFYFLYYSWLISKQIKQPGQNTSPLFICNSLSAINHLPSPHQQIDNPPPGMLL